MFTSYLRFALRNLIKRRAFTLINIFGLAAGVAVCIVIGKYLAFETSFDKFHANADHIYRAVSSFYTNGSKDEYNGYDLGQSLQDNFTEVKSFARLHHNGSLVVSSVDGKEFRRRESNMMFADSTFLKMFSLNFVRGTSESALKNTNSIIVTASIAEKFFNTTDVVGKVLDLRDGWTPGLFEISAVIENLPVNSHLDFTCLLPMQTLLQADFYRNDHPRWDNFHTYVQMQPGTDVEKLNSRIPIFIEKYKGSDMKINPTASFQFQKLADIHYSPDLNNQGSLLVNLYMFAAIALFVLSIAWINYVNLTTARAMERGREVGVKKAIGASRHQLIGQFFIESLLVNLFSIILSVGLAAGLLPLANMITERNFEMNFSDPGLWIVLSILFIAGSLISGVYPAFVLSSFKTTDVIKGKIAKGGGMSQRNGLVAFQFGCSLVLLVGTFIIYRQLDHMRGFDKGFDIGKVVILKGPELGDSKAAPERVQSFKNELLQYSFISGVCTSFSVPGNDPSVSTGVRKLGLPVQDNRIADTYWVDPDFIDLYNIPMLTGKVWDPRVESDMASVIINEETVKLLDLGDNESALNATIVFPFDTGRVIGVMKNHHWNSLKKPFTPMIFKAEKIATANLSIQLNGNTHEAMTAIEKKFKSEFPGDAFSYYFLDDFYRAQYQEEEIFGKLFGLFSSLAIIIGCLGLWGLASFATLYRRKEIGIRKTLGASAASITRLFARQFLRPLIISGVFILPILVYVGNAWLETFPYRISISVDMFLIPLAGLLTVAFFTILYQTLKAASANPVDALKND